MLFPVPDFDAKGPGGTVKQMSAPTTHVSTSEKDGRLLSVAIDFRLESWHTGGHNKGSVYSLTSLSEACICVVK